MSKNKDGEKLPIFGMPLYTVSQNSIVNLLKENKPIRTHIRSSINHLHYYASEAVLVAGVKYADEEMSSYLVNEGTDAEMTVKKEDIGHKVFFDKAEADAIAEEMNQQMKEELHDIANEAMELYHNIDDVIIALQKS